MYIQWARHILSLNIDAGLENGDLSLVEKIAKSKSRGKEGILLLLFRLKILQPSSALEICHLWRLCGKVLIYFRSVITFAISKIQTSKHTGIICESSKHFNPFYGLDKYNLKQIDQYLWQLGRNITVNIHPLPAPLQIGVGQNDITTPQPQKMILFLFITFFRENTIAKFTNADIILQTFVSPHHIHGYFPK